MQPQTEDYTRLVGAQQLAEKQANCVLLYSAKSNVTEYDPQAENVTFKGKTNYSKKT